MGARVRPAPEDVAEPTDITGWYWTKDELVHIAARLAVPRSGTKQHLIEALVAHLAGHQPPVSERAPTSRPLQAPFADNMVIPAGQPFTRALRDWVESRAGVRVRLNAQARELLRDPLLVAGRQATLADLIDLLVNPPLPSGEIGFQFERNRFWRLLSRTAPELTRQQREREWAAFRQLPTERRVDILKDVP